MGLFDTIKKRFSADKEPVRPAPGPSKTGKAPEPSQAASSEKGKSEPARIAEDKKRKTLPKNFSELVASGDIEAIEKVFETTRLDAYSGYSKKTALAFEKMPEKAIRWLIAQGADVNAKDTYGNTPLHEASSFKDGAIGVLVELGADIEAKNTSGCTPLHAAACARIPSVVERLLVLGANAQAQDDNGDTPLEKSLIQCSNSTIPSMVETAEVFLSAGVAVTRKMKSSVENIGKTFEFYRSSFNRDYLEETDAALVRLYELFGVDPVLRRRIHDGASPIDVSASVWQKQHAELWDYLVPGSGYAASVQGEVIRITGKVAYEVLDNGGVNWDDEFRSMLEALVGHLGSATPLSAEELQEAAALVAALEDGLGDDEPNRLSELAVHWVLANPEPLPMEKPPYRR